MMRFSLFTRAVILAAVLAPSSQLPAQLPTKQRTAEEDVDSPDVRNRALLVPGKNLLFNGWGVAPAGEHVQSGDVALKMIVAPDKKVLVAVCAGYNKMGLTVISLDDQRESTFIPLKRVFNGLAFSHDGRQLFVSGSEAGCIYIFGYADGKLDFQREVKPKTEETIVFLAGLAVHPKSHDLYVCNEANHEVWVLDPKDFQIKSVIDVGQHPHTCIFGADAQHLYVSNWGSRSVSIIDTAKGKRLRDLTVGLRPNDMALAPDGRLFVACAGENEVHVIGTARLEKPGQDAGPTRRLWEGTREVIATSLYPQSPEGSTPCSVAVSPNGETLFIANADNNSVMVVDISGKLLEDAAERGEKIAMVNGFIPTGWYPTAVAVTPDNDFLLIANGKGLTSRASFPAQAETPRQLHMGPKFDHTGQTFDGHISFVAKPDTAKMVEYTEQVRRNSPFHPEYLRKAPLPSNSVIPAKVGDPCPIKYVLYIIKENRTYDQVLSDMTDAAGNPIGNGDKRLLMFGEKVTPNHHQLAREYVLFDNLYSNSEVSVDGHSWTDAAIATDFNQRSWILSYSKHGKLPGNEEMENPANGYLWDLCKRHGISFKNYGEGAQRVPSANRGKWEGKRDMDLVQFWIDDLKEAEKTGVLPQFTIMSLGEDHTKGTKVGEHTPDACVASNDLGFGRLVEAATRSKFWKEMAIFVIEDDTQNGPDHVDAHRTIGYVISPYTKRAFVDSTLYTTAGMIRTMELILGLPPLTQYDAGATPMFNAFQDTAFVSPYKALMPEVDLNAKNSITALFSEESGRMNFDVFDMAPEDELNRILWAVTRPNDPYPAPIHRAVFTTPLSE